VYVWVTGENAALTVMVNVKFVLPVELLAVITYPVEDAVTVGVPEMTPVVVLSEIPVGNAGETL
jgi:hypothetical protein